MSLKRQLLVSFGLQGAGAAALLLATLLLGARLGPEVQGTFSRSKSEVEFVAAFAMFGLPQALFFYVKSGALDLRHALRWAFGATALALPLAALYAGWRHAHDGAAAIGLLALAVAAGVLHGQLRTLLLVRGTVGFNVVTALPQLLMLGGVLHVIVRGRADTGSWFALFALAFALAAALAGWRLRRHRRSERVVVAPIGWRALGQYGLAAWLTAALSTAAILLMQRWVEAEQGRAALGRFTMAMTLVQVPLTPISYAAPLLLRRWMEQPGARASRRVAATVFGVLLAAAVALASISERWPDLGLGAAYAGATLALALLLGGAAAEAASRVLTVHASARGLPWIAVRAEAARWALLALGWWWLPTLWPAPGLLPMCLIWALAAWGAAGVFVWYARHAR